MKIWEIAVTVVISCILGWAMLYALLGEAPF